MSLTFLDKKAKFADERRNKLSANTWKMRYGAIELTLNPKVVDRGMIERPSNGDIEYCQGYVVDVGQYVRQEQSIPDEAFVEGAEWEAQNTRLLAPVWVKWTVMSPPKEGPMWIEMTFTPSLLT